MTEETIFAADQATAAPEAQAPAQEAQSTPAPAAPPIPNEWQELVGEGKKYKTVEDATKSLPHQVKHISTLEEENAKMREELAKSKAAEDLLQEIRNSSTEQQKQTSQGVEVNEAVLSEIIEKKLTQRTQKQLQDDNARSVVQAMSGAFGDKAEEVYNKVAQDTGFSVVQLNQLAATNPKAVLKLVGVDGVKSNSSPVIESSVNTQSQFAPNKQEAAPVLLKQGFTSKDLATAWNATKEAVYNKHGIKD